MNSNFQKIKIESKNYTKLATKYHHLRDAWKNGGTTKTKINKIIKLYGIKNATINQSNQVLKINIKNININLSHKFINKILNETIIVNSFNIKKDNLILEVGL
jgi:hypothetical protein